MKDSASIRRYLGPLSAAVAGGLVAACDGSEGGSGVAHTPNDPVRPDPSIPVTPVNTPPSISGFPPSRVAAGDAYEFVPWSRDVDGHRLTFAVMNKPSWATFDPTSGRLGGQPEVGDVGIYAGIVISVSDGMAGASLPEFSINVQLPQVSSVTVSWVPPARNTDGTPLTDLRGYFVYYGTDSGNPAFRVDIRNPRISSAVIEELSPGIWYFFATAYNSAGLESDRSNVASKTVH